MRLRNPSRLLSFRPRLRRSASRSINSTISRVKGHSNSFTDHLTCRRMSSRSSTLKTFSCRPLYKSSSSLARTVNGVSTMVWPSSGLELYQVLCAAIADSSALVFSFLFSALALICSLSMVCSKRVSFFSNSWRASAFSLSSMLLSLIFLLSWSRQASSSLYKMAKSAGVRGCVRRSISRCRFCSWIFRRRSSSFLCSALIRSSSSRMDRANRRAFQPRTWACSTIHFRMRKPCRSLAEKYCLGW
mmetsp:Transcript_56173/g.99991  ORF Transcript_56173/g.99991 Transcript_56173/m.99991 type:complete len:245 (-) Transcript_56173:1193-1927(-)